MNKKNVYTNLGFSLVEILVTLSISLLLISGMISVLLSSKQAYLRKENVNQIQENVRAASTSLQKIISMAEQVHPSSNDREIIVLYQGGYQTQNCLGQPVITGNAINYFYVKKNTLYCSSSYPITTGSQQPLVEGIAAMRVQYGIDVNKDAQVDLYVERPKDWDTVISARFLLSLLDLNAHRQPEVTLTVAMRPRIFLRQSGEF